MRVFILICLLVGNAYPQEVPDISSAGPDLAVPEISPGKPAPGKRVFFRVPGEPDSTPEAIVYLPTDWTPTSRFPVLVELAGNGNYRNQYGDVSTGRPEGSKLGYGLSGGTGFIWVCLPFLNDAGNGIAITWWGDSPEHRPDATIAYLKRAVPALCREFAGDPNRVVLCGFSRGAIACNAIGLHDDQIAKLWAGFICYSHYDGVREGWPFAGSDRQSALVRLDRLDGRPQLICHETSSGRLNLEATRSYLASAAPSGNFTFIETGFRNHNDAWTLRPSEARKKAREWLRKVTAP